MRILTKPKVYLIARPQIVESGIEAFLKDQKLDWPTPTEGVKDAERLVEICGRNCYMSYGNKAGSKTNKRYIQNLLGRNDDGTFKPGPAHGSVCEHPNWTFLVVGAGRGFSHEQVRHRSGWAYCLDGDTEIWIDHLHKGVRQGVKKRKIADLHNNPSQWKRITNVRCYDEEQKKFVCNSIKDIQHVGSKPCFKVNLDNGKSITTTKEHRFLTSEGWQSLDEACGGISVTSGDLATFSVQPHLATNGVIAYQDAKWLDQKYNTENLKIADIADECNVSYHTIRKWIRVHNIQHQQGGRSKDPWNKGKKYHGGWHHSMSTRKLFSEQKKGSRNPQWNGGGQKSKISRLIREKVYKRDQYVCAKCDTKGGSLTLHHIFKESEYPNLKDNPSFLITLCKKCHHSLNNKESQWVKFFLRKIDANNLDYQPTRTGRKQKYRGSVLIPRFVQISSIEYVGLRDVYDIEMSDNGPSNFVANGFIVHNSQLSTRYCDFEREEQEGTWDPGFCIPTLANLSKETADSMKVLLKESQKSYVKLLEMIENDLKDNTEFMNNLSKMDEREAKRALRKAARGAARDILPIATEAIMTMTANARAIWNCLVLRANEHAEAVIRDIYVQICYIMEEEMPALFNHIKYIQCWDGTEAVVMPRDKL